MATTSGTVWRSLSGASAMISSLAASAADGVESEPAEGSERRAMAAARSSRAAARNSRVLKGPAAR